MPLRVSFPGLMWLLMCNQPMPAEGQGSHRQSRNECSCGERCCGGVTEISKREERGKMAGGGQNWTGPPPMVQWVLARELPTTLSFP